MLRKHRFFQIVVVVIENVKKPIKSAVIGLEVRCVDDGGEKIRVEVVIGAGGRLKATLSVIISWEVQQTTAELYSPGGETPV